MQTSYPGFQGMIKEFEDIFVWWWMDECPKIEYKVQYFWKGFDGTLDARKFPQISFSQTYDVNRSGFLLLDKTTIEENLLKNYCTKNRFSYRIQYFSKLVTVYIDVPNYETLKRSSLMNSIHEIYQWLSTYMTLSQKFAITPLMNKILEHVSKYHCKTCSKVFNDFGIVYPGTRDSDGYTTPGYPSFIFKELGYRNLNSMDELIAFMFAYFSRVHWNTFPNNLKLYNIRWHYYRNQNMKQKIDILPSYCQHDPLTYKPVEKKPILKDFFDTL